MRTEYNLGWGDPVVVREALIETSGIETLTWFRASNLGYPPHFGSPELIERLKDMAQRQSGHRPKHLFVTCGATGAINAALYALKTLETHWVVTNKRYYPIYPEIINISDLIMIDRNKKEYLTNKSNGCVEDNFISLTDSPSAPEGLVYPFELVDIWDAAYSSKTYSSGGHIPTVWRIMVGSLSKTLGLPGLRLGWVSTDNDGIAKSLGRYVTANYVGLSSLSMYMAEEILSRLNTDKFETRSSAYLDDNREEMQKVLTKFGQGDVPNRGMFALLKLDKLEIKALEKANVKWQPGSSWGEDDSWARLNLGQSRKVVKSAVKAILK